MPRILFLDDNPERHKRIASSLQNYDAAYTAEQAIDYLKENTYDVIFLDHDLGGQEMVESGPNTGYAVAQYIADNSVPCKMIIIHTLNPAGADNMISILAKVGTEVFRVPFLYLPMVVGDLLEGLK